MYRIEEILCFGYHVYILKYISYYFVSFLWLYLDEIMTYYISMWWMQFDEILLSLWVIMMNLFVSHVGIVFLWISLYRNFRYHGVIIYRYFYSSCQYFGYLWSNMDPVVLTITSICCFVIKENISFHEPYTRGLLIKWDWLRFERYSFTECILCLCCKHLCIVVDLTLRFVN